MTTVAPPQSDMTVEELAARVGAVPLWRIRTDPPPGTATEEDVERIRQEEGSLCELIDGVLVEKAVSNKTSILAAEIITILRIFVKPRRLGWIQAPDGYVWITGTQLRAPDVSFIRRDQFPGGRVPDYGFESLAPALVVEVVSPGNTLREIEQKRREYLAAGTELVWIVYPDRQEIEVSTGADAHQILKRNDTLDGGTVLPRFSVKVAEIFDALA